MYCEDIKRIDVFAPNLKFVEYRGDAFHLKDVIWRNAVPLEKSVLLEINWSFKYKNLLRGFGDTKELYISHMKMMGTLESIIGAWSGSCYKSVTKLSLSYFEPIYFLAVPQIIRALPNMEIFDIALDRRFLRRRSLTWQILS